MKLYCFNPEHDLAIANGNENFQAPESALLLASDLSLLPAWYAEEGSMVMSEQVLDTGVLPVGLEVECVAPYSGGIPAHCTVEPWGWDAALRKGLMNVGVHEGVLPSVERLQVYRRLAHRRSASIAMEYVRARAERPDRLPNAAVELQSMGEVHLFAQSHAEVVLKSPWSGSGKGVFWSRGALTQSLTGWCQRVMERQGSVMGEVAMERIQDFAMEYRVRNGVATFAGYSLFITEGSGIYRGNRLMSNEGIVRALGRWVSEEYLQWINDTMRAFVNEHIAPLYDGYVGVDMFVYRGANGEVCIDPAVEINLRMTMGMVARLIYDRYVHGESSGWFVIDHEPPGQLLRDHNIKRNTMPMVMREGRLAEGYVSLCPVLPNTVYRASVLLSEHGK